MDKKIALRSVRVKLILSWCSKTQGDHAYFKLSFRVYKFGLVLQPFNCIIYVWLLDLQNEP